MGFIHYVTPQIALLVPKLNTELILPQLIDYIDFYNIKFLWLS